MKLIVFAFLPFYLACSRSSKTKKTYSGIVNVTHQIFDSGVIASSKPVIKWATKIWYKDSLSIQEVKLLRFFTSSKEKTFKEILLYYIFIDPKYNSYYYYKNFSDTASIFKSYAGVDSFKVDGGWNFYLKKDLNYEGSPEVFNDTVINQIRYKRMKFNTLMGKDNYITIAYFRCDKIGTMFKFDYSYSEKLGCPLTKIDDFPTERGTSTKTEIDFLTNGLTSEELKVFDAWEKNEKKYPVK